MRDRVAAAFAHGLLLARVRMAVERRVDGAARPRRRAPDDGEIAALQRAFALVGELLAERAVGAVVLGHHHQAGGVLVEPVHDAGPLDAADARQAVAAMGDQRVDQRAGGVAGGRMHHQALRLVDHDERVVLVDDVERDRLGRRLGRFRLRQRDGNDIAGIDLGRRIADCARRDRDLTGQDQRLQARARQRWNPRRQHAIEPPARFLRRYRHCLAGAVRHCLGLKLWVLKLLGSSGPVRAMSDEKLTEADQAKFMAKVRRLMLIASATTVLAVGAVIAVIGYRVFHWQGSVSAPALPGPPRPDMTATLPAGAKVLSSAIGEGRLVLTVEVAGGIELRSFDLNTLKPLGMVRLAPPP